MGSSAPEPMTVGRVAKATGLTVRTLHHYDELGLLVPGGRTGAGYRLYDADDLRRLFHIVALRRLGVPLKDIGPLLDREGDDLARTVDEQLEAAERALGETQRLRDRLLAIRDALARRQAPSVDDLIDAMEAMTMYERYYTPDQLERLRRRREEVGDERIAAVQQEWAELHAALRREMEAGTDPADPRLRPYAERGRALFQAFTGGDRDIAHSLKRLWENEDPERVSCGAVDRELADYYRLVMEAGGTPL
jgi:DNA-binding transcriptional MerR regulator